VPRPRRRLSRVRRPLLALIALLAALAIGYTVRAVDSHDSHSSGGLQTVALSSLPVQVAQTVRLIDAGGPYPFPHNDGVVFHNNEHQLPRHADGYYREYTVPTPGSPDRGARRLIRGGDGTLYYTGDHYEHFVVVDVTR
jgi:ribonuclease T1